MAAVFLDHFRKHAFSFANGRQWVLTNAEAHEMDKLYDRLSGFAQLSPPAPSTPRAVCAENAKVRHFWTTLFWLEIMEKNSRYHPILLALDQKGANLALHSSHIPLSRRACGGHSAICTAPIERGLSRGSVESKHARIGSGTAKQFLLERAFPL